MMRLLIACQLMLFSATVPATEMIYRPINPSFGGNVSNGTFLMNQATEQNTLKAPTVVAPVTPQRTPIDTFKANLQSSILSRLSSTTTASLFDTNGNIKLGSDLNFDLNNDGQSDFSVLVSDTPTNGNVSISITDGITNTNLVVPYSATP